MLLRAAFWIGVVSLMMPREPDLGFGRPHMGGAAPWTGTTASESFCGEHQEACLAGLSLVGEMQSAAVRSLGEVRKDIEESQRERLARGRSP